MKNLLKKVLLVLPALAFLVTYMQIPEEVTITEGQKLDFNWGITASADTEKAGSFDCRVKLFNCIPIKTVNVSVTPEYYVIPSGETIGVKVHTDGILVVGVSEVKGENGRIYEPAKDAGIKAGDRVVAVNKQAVTNTAGFCKMVNDCDGKVILEVIRDGRNLNAPVNAVYSEESESYKVGLWVRDSAAGIGTLTFYNPENSSFAALGHGICDSDTKDILTVKRGSITECKIRRARKGERGNPGELIGDFSSNEVGEVLCNTPIGIYGKCNSIPKKEAIKVASRFEVTEGKAQVMCDVDGQGPKAYEIEITKVSKSPKITNKDFVIKVTDEQLTQKTGGIVQGMSGSPIIQNDKLIGAITHVFINEPARGYGIFIENMLAEAEKIK